MEILRLSVQAPLASALAAASLPRSPLEIAIAQVCEALFHAFAALRLRFSLGEGPRRSPARKSPVKAAALHPGATAVFNTFDCLIHTTKSFLKP